MKTTQKPRSGGESCSCTSCVYKSESDHASLRKFIAQGSRIDRIYYGKYIPLRERKLLERLVRTRAVYDDIRAQLLSDSTLSLNTKAEKRGSPEEIDDTEKSSGAVLEMVNMVDKGAALGPTKISDCCSCCSCSSKVNIFEYNTKRHRQKRANVAAYKRGYAKERIGESYNRKKGVRFKTKHIRSDPCTCTFKFSGMLKKHSKSMLKRKHPEPPLPSLDIQPTTDEKLKQKRGRIKDIARTSYQNLKQSNIRIKEKISEEINKIKESQTRIQEELELQTKKSLEKLTQAKNKLASKVKAGAQRKRRKKIKTELSCLCLDKEIDSIRKFKEDLRRKQIMKDWECEPECIQDTCIPKKCFFKLKQKQSEQKNAKYKGITNDLMTRERKTGETLPQSDTKIQTQSLVITKTTETERRKPISRTEQKQEVKDPRISFSKDAEKKDEEQKSRKGSNKENKKNCACEIYRDTSKMRKVKKYVSLINKPEKQSNQEIKVSYPPNESKLPKQRSGKGSNKGNKKNCGCGIYRDTSKMRKVKKSFSLITTPEKQSNQEIKVSYPPNESKLPKQRLGIDYSLKRSVKYKKTKKRQLRHQGPEVMIKKSLKGSQTVGQGLKRCFCTFKLKAKSTKSSNRRPSVKNVITSEKSVLTLNSSLLQDKILKVNDVRTNTATERKKRKKYLLPYECEPGVCIPGDCNPYKCIQLITVREPNLSSSRKTKSTSSLTFRSHKPSKATYVQSLIAPRGDIYTKAAVQSNQIKLRNIKNKSRQAVSFGSSFNFNIEFYKDTPYNATSKELKSLSIKPKEKIYQTENKKGQRHHKNVGNIRKNTPTQMYKKERNTFMGTSLKRCFCTLKLQRKETSKKRNKKTFTTGLENTQFKYLHTANKSTKTKSRYSRSLKPFECEPFTCTPGACDPYVCLERINRRNIRLKEAALNTKSPETTTSSCDCTTYFDKSFRTVQVQYKPKYKERKVGVTNTKIPVIIPKKYTANIDTHVHGPRKNAKSSVVEPLPKRCFCTLNLQKGLNHQYSKKETYLPKKHLFFQPKIYTVNTAMIGKAQFITFDEYQDIKRIRHDHNNNYHKALNSAQLINNNQVSSINRLVNKLEEEHEIFKKTTKCKKSYNTCPKRPLKRLDKFIEPLSQTHHNQFPILGNYFPRCFYTMNLNVENRDKKNEITDYSESSKVKRRALHKLKPYECEPGVCIPGECNPYECQKLISKRFNKSFSKKSSTEYSSKSISSSTNKNVPKSKSNKQQTLVQRSTKPYVYKAQPKNTQKQVVHIGSSFSFDIQFNKSFSGSQTKLIKPNRYSSDIELSKHVKNLTKYGGIKKQGIQDSQSQSAVIKTKHKGSFTIPTVRRCFCTLKLQKKGKFHKELQNKPIIPSKEVHKQKTVSIGQNTKKFKPLNLAHLLKPYECKPNICISGQCDPYRCLEIMKKEIYLKRKNEFGTSTILPDTKSVSSMTTGNQSKKLKNRAIAIKPQPINKYKTRTIDYNIGDIDPLRKAVRVGSSFSFNIDFFKEAQPKSNYFQRKPIQNNNLKDPEYSSKLRHRKDTIYGYSKHHRNLRHKLSQIDNFDQSDATLPNSLLKRCFCTAQLYKSKKHNKEQNTPSFLKKCLCFIKPKNRTSNLPANKNKKHVNTHNKKINTLNIKDTLKLLPYECTPGICIPGECDPFVCEKIMNKQKYQENFSASASESLKTRSVSSNSSPVTKKNVKTFIKQRKNLEINKTEKKNAPSLKRHLNLDRKAVRIGSNLSFDIQFYKENPLTVKDNKQFKIFSTRNSKSNNRNDKKVKPTAFKQLTSSTTSQSSQVKTRMKDRATGLSNFIKRCFCTLKLKEKKYSDKNKIKGKEDINSKKVKNISVMTVDKHNKLSNGVMPCECESNIYPTSVPCQCDPYKCEKRIKLRHKDVAISTKGPKNISTRIKTGYRKPKIKAQSIKEKYVHRHGKENKIKEKYSNMDELCRSRQSVKLGSSFSFNVEFFKDKHHSSFELNNIPRKKILVKEHTKKLTKDKKKTHTNKTQVDNKKMRTKSTMTGFSQLKRCFCTLSLKKTHQDLPAKKSKASVSTETDVYKTHKQSILKLLPYECEPFVCVPGECNPLECLKRIKIRQRDSGTSTNYPHKKNVAITMTKKAKNKKSQYKYLKTPSKFSYTNQMWAKQNSEKEPLKQAVRIGSNFSFDVEFYKNKIYDMEENLKHPNLFPMHRVVRKNIHVIKHAESHDKKNRKMKLKSLNTNTKKMASNANPFLKRCFCVLKLHKIGKEHKPAPLKPKTGKNQTIQNEYQKGYKHINQKLKPFKCEHNICFLGSCNPYKVEKLLTNRDLQESSAETEKLADIYKSNTTSDLLLKSIKAQTFKTKFHEQQEHGKKMFVKKTGNNTTRQAIRIGSNFSFDMEFYKTKCPNEIDMVNKQELKDNKYFNNVKSNLKKKKFQTRALQSEYVKIDTNSSIMDPFLKRCFCTIKRQKHSNKNPKTNLINVKLDLPQQRLRQIPTVNKGIATNKTSMKVQELSPYECEPFYCIPGICNPYECEERIKMRKMKCKLRNTTTQVVKKSSKKSVGIKTQKLISQRIQTRGLDAVGAEVSPPYSHGREIVEIPRFNNIFNKKAVRIGSNFSFNIEFYKEAVPPIAAEPNYEQKLKRKKLSVPGDKNINMYNLRSHGSQGDNIKTFDKFVEAENVLKRCFCTLKLQNLAKTKNEKQTMQNINKLKFPQSLEVRRVAVQHKPKMLPKQTHIEFKSVGTKTNKKCLKNNTDAACNAYLCQGGRTILPDDMKTILPYKPTKFNKAISKTELPLKNYRPLLENTDYKQKGILKTNHRQRLTRKRSKKHLHYNKDPEKTSPKLGLLSIKKFFIRCTNFFYHNKSDREKKTANKNQQKIGKTECNQNYSLVHQNKMQLDGLKSSKSERQARFNQVTNTSPKKSKSLKLGSKTNKCKKTCPYYANLTKMNLTYQGGDIEKQYPVMSLNINRKQLAKRNKNEAKIGHQKYAHELLYEDEDTKNKIENILCTHCLLEKRLTNTVERKKVNMSALKVQFAEPVVFKNNIDSKIHGKKRAESFKYDTKCERRVQLCKYCHSCGAKINNQEFNNAAGDQIFNKKNINKKKSTDDKQKRKKSSKKVDNICSGEKTTKPLFEMQLDTRSYEILNKEEVFANVSKLNARTKKTLSLHKYINKRHEKSCRCCICLAEKNKTGAKLIVKAKGPKFCGAFSRIFWSKPKVKSAYRKPCVCGSIICAKKAQSLPKKPSTIKYRWKPCVCGSAVCDRESAIMKTISGKVKCICQEELTKSRKILKARNLKIERKERAFRLKQQSKEDRLRKKKRRKENKRMEKGINKKSSDVVLLAENAIDIGKLGITACSDILRVVARSAADPKHAYKKLKTIKDNPKLLARHLKLAYDDSGVAATTKRVRLRCLAMKGVKKVRTKLESYAVTKYLLYIASKDPKRRLVKPQRVRERLDFGCSLYMGSLRKRPFLSIYDRCPWFYPHFLSLVNVWKQFMDITLFLMAVVVWSPCILCMEVCRAMMCCFFCTG